MAYALTDAGRLSVSRSSRIHSSDGIHSSDDSLDAMRGIIFGALLSVLVFWLPLAVALTR